MICLALKLQTMNSRELKAPHLGFRFFLSMALAAALTVTVLKIVSAPFWSLYLAGIIAAPFILYAIRKHDAVRPSPTGNRKIAGRETEL